MAGKAMIFNTDDMAEDGEEYPRHLWFADDGSWGSGRMVIIDTSKWWLNQLTWFNRYMMLVNDPDQEVIIEIDNNIEPDWSQYK